MDPVTVIGLLASLTNLIHASRATLRVVDSFKDADRELLSLSNDVSVFAEALSGFERVLRSRQTIHRISPSVIETMLANSLDTIHTLDDRLQQMSNSSVSTVRRVRWVQGASAVKKLHDRLKELNMMLQTFLAITHASVALLTHA